MAGECVVIEDTPAGLEAARAARMPSIAIAGTYPAPALTMADLIVPSLAALPGELIERVISRGASPPDRPRR
jgi:sugar-phosphatase